MVGGLVKVGYSKCIYVEYLCLKIYYPHSDEISAWINLTADYVTNKTFWWRKQGHSSDP